MQTKSRFSETVATEARQNAAQCMCAAQAYEEAAKLEAAYYEPQCRNGTYAHRIWMARFRELRGYR